VAITEATMSYEPPPPPSPTNRALIVVVVVLASVLLLGFGGCTVLGLLGYFWSNRAAMVEREMAEVARTEAMQAQAAQAQLARERASGEPPGAKEDPEGSARHRDWLEAYDCAKSFLRYIRDDRYDEAYTLVTAGYKQRLDRESFAKLFAKHASFKKELNAFGMVRPVSPTDRNIHLQYVSGMAEGIRLEARFTLCKEKEGWLIDRIDITEHKTR
jgi:hypothetical protein